METPRGLDAPPASARWGLLALTLAAGLLRLHGLAAEEPWFDEVFSIVVSSQDLPTLWRSALADQTNPPGFYVLLWGWIQLGGLDLAWLRLLPALASTVTVPAVAFAARSLGLGIGPALLAACLAAVSPLMLAMAHELRTYALLALATTLTLATVLRGHRAGTIVGYLSLVALHYFGALVVAALAVGEVLRDPRRWRTTLLTALPAAVALSAWLALTIGTAHGPIGRNAAWIPAFRAQALVDLAAQTVGSFGTVPGAALVCSALLATLGLALASARRTPALRPVLALALVPLLLVVLAALLGRSLWVTRYLIIVLPAWWLLLAAMPARWHGTRARVVLLAIACWAVPAGLSAERERPRKTDWSAVARALVVAGPRSICTDEFYVALPLRYQALQRGIPLTILDLDACLAARRPDALIRRPGTEATLRLLAARGATIGPATDLRTTFPETQLVPLGWPSGSR